MEFNAKNINMGDRNEAILPRYMATPERIVIKLRYIGFRLYLKGPTSISFDGLALGLSVVFIFKKSLTEERPRIIPKKTRITPKYVNGA